MANLSEGEVRARLWAVDIINGRVTLVRFIWAEQRSEYLRRNPTARAVQDIRKFGTDSRMYSIQRGMQL